MNPKLLEALNLHQNGQMEQAASIYQSLISQGYQNFDLYFLYGILAAQTNNPSLAAKLFKVAVEIDPGSELANNNLGVAFLKLNNIEAALHAFNNAINLKKDYFEAIVNKTTILVKLKRHEEAIAAYDQLIKLQGNDHLLFNDRGVSYKKLGKNIFAIQDYNRALALNPNYAEAYSNRANAYTQLRQFDQALQDYDRALTLNPNYAEAYSNRANAYTQLRQFDQALQDYTRALSINPNYAEAHSNRANTLRILKQYGNALQGYQKALALDPHAEFVPGMALHLKMMMCDWNNYDADLHNLSTLISNGQAASEPFPVLSLLDSLQLQLQITRIYQAIKFKGIERLSLPAPANRQNKIRIGYFSADFRDHPVSYLLVELFERHDRSRFETFAFSLGENTNDSMRNRLSKAFDHFIDVENASDSEIANLSRSHEIDIVVDLGGYTAGARPEIFALRAAPIQVSYIGYLGTMGTGFIDYIVADKTLIPEESRQFYTEKIAYLPSYQANPSDRKIAKKVFTRAELGISENAFVFCCFNNNYKITPPTFASWMNILRAVEGSVLYLYSENDWVQAHLENTVSAHGITKDRLIFGKRLPMPEYLARYQAADLFLDTFPYNAGTTTSDSLWAGTPVLTLMGETFASRMAASLLTAIDMPELITRSSQEYEALAIKIAQDKKLASGLKSKLQTNKLNTKLFNTSAFVQSLEALYTQMYQRHQAGLLPEDLG